MDLHVHCTPSTIFTLCVILTVCSLLSCFTIDAYKISGNETDRLALLEFKAKMVGPDGALSSWNTSAHFCQWHGVTCGRRHRRVTVLKLRSQGLKGTITPHIGNLSFLRVLDLENNSIYSSIPPEVGRLSRLRYLHLSNNSLSGQIPPSLSRCSNLLGINLRVNILEGDLPSDLGSLSKLKSLQLELNNLTGSFPLTYGNLSSLEILTVMRNDFSGPIPETLGKLRKLKFLSLAANNFLGTIPSSIFNITSMETLDMSTNQLVGRLPWDLGFAFPNLQFLGASSNHFTGPIPPSISNVSILTYIGFGANNFTGHVPSFQKMNKLNWLTLSSNHLGSGQDDDLDFLCSLTNSTSLEMLQFAYNNFGGTLPECLASISSTLTTLRLEHNYISGSLSSGIGNLTNLETVLMVDNNLSGTIPYEVGNLRKLNLLNLALNRFSGQIPDSFGNFTMMTKLALYSNNLHGNIPSSLSNCQKMIALDLSFNNLQGLIPREVMGISSLSIYADFSENNFSGELPLEIGNLHNLEALSLAGNNLSGEIPSTIGSCTMLEELDMQDNQFQGSIPSTLSSLKGIQEMNFSNNRLSSQIPRFLEDLPLKSLDLSFNEFEGALPTGGIFANASATSIAGNMKLCGGRPEFHLPKCNGTGKPRTKTSMRTKSIISVSGFVGLIAFALFLVYFFWYRKKRLEATSTNPNEGLLKVSYQNLLNATNGLSPSNLIGVGSFGSVYKGLLDQDQATVAVKVLNLNKSGASKSFIAECMALRNIRHRNLVKVLTACSGSDYQGNDFKALIYEFMSNGSLDDWLHPTTGASEAPKHLSLLQRLDIAIDVACALDYLHHQCETPIVHCDLKPNNVLLDDEMIAHVGDFGLVRIAPEATQELITDKLSSIGVKGSLGYIAPGNNLTSIILHQSLFFIA